MLDSPRRRIRFGTFELGPGIGETLRPIDADVGDDALVDIVLGVDRRRRKIDRRRRQPQSGGQPDDPVRGISADETDGGCNGKIPQRGASGWRDGFPG